MYYDKNHRSAISFPLGGIGTGCIGLDGSGHLVDWEIENHPNKESSNRYSHFAVKAEVDGSVLDARILNGDMTPPYMGHTCPAEAAAHAGYCGFGYGAKADLLPGLPHFSETEFSGEFPVVAMQFKDPRFPGEITLSAFNPFIPLNSFDSSLPGALFEFTVRNNSRKTITYTLAGSLSATPGKFRSRWNQDQLTMKSEEPPESVRYGELSLAAAGGCWQRWPPMSAATPKS